MKKLGANQWTNFILLNSPAYGGSTSERPISERSSIVDKSSKNDSPIGDRGSNMQDICAARDITVNIPTFLKREGQIPGIRIIEDRKLAS